MLQEIVGLQVFKSWHVFATRMFYFADPRCKDQPENGGYRLALECPWRVEQYDRILVGSDDYGERATDNSDPDWNPSDMQRGHLQDQKLVEIMGEDRNGAIYNTQSELEVETAAIDSLGGFQLSMSGGYRISVFPFSRRVLPFLSGNFRARLAAILH